MQNIKRISRSLFSVSFASIALVALSLMLPLSAHAEKPQEPGTMVERPDGTKIYRYDPKKSTRFIINTGHNKQQVVRGVENIKKLKKGGK